MTGTWKPAAGGILSIIAGAFSGLAGVVIISRGEFVGRMMWHWRFDNLGIFYLMLGIVAIIGGVFALRRQAWGLALAGAICALFPTPSVASILNIVLGTLAIIFISLSRGEFGQGAATSPPPLAGQGQ